MKSIPNILKLVISVVAVICGITASGQDELGDLSKVRVHISSLIVRKGTTTAIPGFNLQSGSSVWSGTEINSPTSTETITDWAAVNSCAQTALQDGNANCYYSEYYSYICGIDSVGFSKWCGAYRWRYDYKCGNNNQTAIIQAIENKAHPCYTNNTQQYPVARNEKFLYLELGVDYSLAITSANGMLVSTAFMVPEEYLVFIKDASGLYKPASRTEVGFSDISKTVQFQLRQKGTKAPALLGQSSDLHTGDLRWELQLGTLGNGDSAGRLVFQHNDLTATCYTRAGLKSYLPISNGDSEVEVVKDANGLIRQVKTPGSFVNLVDTVTASGAVIQYEIRMYAPLAAVATKSSGLYSVSGLSMLTKYAIGRASTQTLNDFFVQQYDGSGTLLRTDEVTKIPTGSSVNGIALNHWQMITTANSEAANVNKSSTIYNSAFSGTRQEYQEAGQNPIKYAEENYNFATQRNYINLAGIGELKIAEGRAQQFSLDGSGNVIPVWKPKSYSYFYGMDSTQPAAYGQRVLSIDHFGGFKYYIQNENPLTLDFAEDSLIIKPGDTGFDPSLFTSASTVDHDANPSTPSIPVWIASVLQVNSQFNYFLITRGTDYDGISRRDVIVTEARNTAGNLITLGAISQKVARPAFFTVGTQKIEVLCSYAPHDFPDSSNRRRATFTASYTPDTANPRLIGKPYFVFRPDSTKTSYGYREGTYRGGANAFTTVEVNGYHATSLSYIDEAATAKVATVTHGSTTHTSNGTNFTIDAIQLVPGKSTRTVTVRNTNGWVMFIENWAYNTASQWVMIDDIANFHDGFGRLVSTTRDGRTVYEANWTGLRKRWEKNEAGMTTTFAYDGIGRVIAETVTGATGVAGIPNSRVKKYFYDARDRVVVKETVNGSETLVEKALYDAEGYLISQTDASGLTTTYSYEYHSPDTTLAGFCGLIKTTHLPDWTKKREYIKQNGELWKEERINAAGNPYEEAAYSYTHNVSPPAGSGLGTTNRLIRVEKSTGSSVHPFLEQFVDASGAPRFERSSTATTNPFEKIYNVSNTTGQLLGSVETEVSSSGAALTLNKVILYDNMGRPYRSGIDVDGSGLALGGTDRVSDEETKFVTSSSVTWQENVKTVYPNNGQSTGFSTTSRSKLTGLAAGILSTQEIEDVHASITTTNTAVDRASASTTSTTTYPDNTTAVHITTNGLVRSEKDRQNNTITNEYDGAGRLIKKNFPRGYSSTTVFYPNSSFVQTTKTGVVSGSGGYATRFTYVPQGNYGAGQVATSTDPGDRVTYRSYDHRGNVTFSWGVSSHPVWTEYDSFGRPWKLHTYASSAADFSGSTWPASAGNGDVTTTEYHGGTSLPSSRTDAAGRATLFSFDTRGRLASTTSPASSADSNTVATAALTTSHSYDSKTDELLGVTYSDSTPAITYTYKRSGAVETVTDAAGTRTFTYQYNASGAAHQKLQLLGESVPSAYTGTTSLATGGTDYLFNTLGYLTQSSNSNGNMKGRPAGVAMGAGSAGVVATSRYSSAYGYDHFGRINSVGVESSAVTYLYAPNSSLLQTRTSSANLSETRGYEANRDLLDVISTTGASQLHVGHDYSYDDLGRRKGLTQTGGQFSGYGGNIKTDYGYTDRDELKSFDAKVGSSTGPLVNGRSYGFGYDQLGNRKKTSRQDAPEGQREFAYEINPINQISSRNNPGWTEISGIIDTSITPSFGTWPTKASPAKRNDKYFHAYHVGRTSPNAEGQTQNLILVKSGAGGADPVNGGNKDLISKQDVAVSLRASNETLKYDARGNLCEDSQWQLTWDGADRLITISTKDAAITTGVKPVKLGFSYDYLNRRYAKRTYSRVGSSWSANPTKLTLYYWSGWNLLAEATYATTWSGSTLSSATFESGRKYYWGLDWSGSLQGAGGVGGLVGITRKEGAAAVDGPVFPAFDGNGNVMGLLTSAGISVAAYEYDPFGLPIRATGTWAKANSFRFATKLYDSEARLIYHQARYYSPDLGRFISQDPAGTSGGLNLYAFVNNNPVGTIDYLGYVSYFSDSYTFNTTSLDGTSTSTFDSQSFNQDYYAFSSAVDMTYSSAYSHFSQQYLPTEVKLANDWSNLGAWAQNVWDYNLAKNTSFNNDFFYPRYAENITQQFFGNPLSLTTYGYGMLDSALTGLSNLRNYAESNPYDPQGSWTRFTEIAAATPSALEYAARELTGFNSFANVMGAEFTPGFRSIEEVGTEGRIMGGIGLATMFTSGGIADDGFRIASKAEAVAIRTEGLAAKTTSTLDASAIRFSQSNVRSSLPEITASMRANGWQGAPIDVVRMADGTLTAVDNTRLAAAALSNTPVQATIRGFGEAFPAARAGGNLQGGTWGEALLNRIGGQRPAWQRLYPSGSPFTGVQPSTPGFSP